MRINKKLIAHLEKLARIELSPESAEKITAQLDSIVSYVEQLQEIPTTGIQPAGLLPHGKTVRLREDRVTGGLPHDTVLGQAPDTVEGFFRVPRVIDKGDQ